MNKLQRILIISAIISTSIFNTIFSAPLLPNVLFTKVELKENDDYNNGFQRLAKVMRKGSVKDAKVTSISMIKVQDHPEILSHYKVTIDSEKKWAKGNWIIDLVPYTQENMSIEAAKAFNNEYQYWFVYYANNKPEAVAWARYGH